MDKKCCIIFPNQLFRESIFIDSDYKIFLIEEDLFFNQYNFHKQKISFHRSSMKFYEDYLVKKGLDVSYINSYENESNIVELIKNISSQGYKKIEIYDPVDYLLDRRIKRLSKELNIDLVVHESKLFINSTEELKYFFKDSKQKFFQTSFYKAERKKRKILINSKGEPEGGEWTYDIQNRKKFPKDKIPPVIKNPKKNSYVIESEKYVEKNFNNNFGSLGLFNYPTTYDEADEWLNQFLNDRFLEFGDYEDAIIKDELTLNHSILSPLLNVGLINIKDLLDISLEFSKANDIPINSTEGFIRQLIGWREFIRGIYIAKGSFERTNNFWGFKSKIPKSFYDGTTGIEPLDSSIKKVSHTGYIHHIERLMIVGNFMLLCEFDPDEVYRWFMEVSIDSFDWVMVPNVFGMGTYADGGIFSTKPYICGSSYMLRMSNYKKGEWCDAVDGLYWRFIETNREFFAKNPRLGLMLKSLDKMSEERKIKIL